jgi:hypothetical protein
MHTKIIPNRAPGSYLVSCRILLLPFNEIGGNKSFIKLEGIPNEEDDDELL